MKKYRLIVFSVSLFYIFSSAFAAEKTGQTKTANQKKESTIGQGSKSIEVSKPTEVSKLSNEPIIFTVEKAVDYAMANSRTLKSEDIDLEVKRRALKYSWNVFFPTVQATVTANRSNNVDSALKSANSSIEMANSMAKMFGGPQTPLVKEKESMHWAVIGNINVSLNLSLASIEQIRSAKLAYEGGEISWGQTRRETTTNIKKLFYGLLLQQENLKIQKNTLESARRRSEQARINFDNGLIPELKYLQASVAYENQKPTVSDAQRLFNQQLDLFAFMLGLPVGTKIELSGNITPTYVSTSADELLERYGSNSLAVRSLNNSLESLQSSLQAVNLSTYTPALALGWNYNPMITNATDTDWSKSENWNDSGSLSVTLAWNLTNLLPFSSNRLQAKELKSNIEKLEISMETVLENQKVQVRKSVDMLTNAREQIDVMRRNINLAQRSYDMAAKSYQNGTTELLELRDTENQLYQAQLALANQKYNYISALLDLENTLDADLSKEYVAKTK